MAIQTFSLLSINTSVELTILYRHHKLERPDFIPANAHNKIKARKFALFDEILCFLFINLSPSLIVQLFPTI
jgi:hypothetical protein